MNNEVGEILEEVPRTRYVLILFYQDTDFIQDEDVHKLVDELEKIETPRVENQIDILIHSNGGDIYPAYKMVHMIRQKCSNINMVVPFSAKSAATLISLGADNIVLGPQSELGPLDAPMEHPVLEGINLSALDGIRPLEFLSNFCTMIATDQLGVRIRQDVQLGRKDSVDLALRFASDFINPIVGKLDPWVINMCYRRLKIAERYGKELLMDYMFCEDENREEKAENTIVELVWEYPEHSYAISYKEAKSINLNVMKARSYPDWNNFWKCYTQLRTLDSKIILLLKYDEFIRAVIEGNTECSVDRDAE